MELGALASSISLLRSCESTKISSRRCRFSSLSFFRRQKFRSIFASASSVIHVNSWNAGGSGSNVGVDGRDFLDAVTSIATVRASSMAGKAVIKVIGVGGGGCNAVSQMVNSRLPNVEFWAVNTDSQALRRCIAPNKLQIGKETTFGRGSGGKIEVGEEAATESLAELSMALEGADLIFIAAGMGGGTGSGAGPVVARLAKAMGALTVGIVTQPFTFEGKKRAAGARLGMEAMKNASDTLVVVPNDKLLETVSANTSIVEAFSLADDILRQGVQGISDIITVPGLVNVDFADVKAIMSNAGSAMLGIGVGGHGKDRAEAVSRAAIMSPLLQCSMNRPMGIVYNVTGGPDLTLHEVNVVADRIYSIAHPNANVIFGAVIDESFKGKIRVTVIATGFQDQSSEEGGAESLDSLRYKTVEDDIFDWERGKSWNKVTEVPEFLKKRARRKD
ncbi:uncharacterized protein LOC9649378 [Selaginella moellendorffii]|nr:uncharacterized protein LOC9649378 [Selaginella moellendorffii]|eukprot:XP_002976496.2 uncharacterized protein LOC9649378 [Selaginella moellendorffii]